MTVFAFELKRGRLSLIIWTAVIVFMLCITVLIYPQMASQMATVTDMFADMGAFSTAFGMDKLNFGEFIGYFAVECGNVLGLGGALFAAIMGISAIAKEEKERTAEFLYTQPLSRTRVVAEKYAALIVQILILNAVVCGAVIACAAAIGETADIGTMLLLMLAYLLLQLEIASICFGISAFLRGGGIAIGLGLALLLYFMNIISNITEDAKALKYVTPFAYADGADITASGTLNMKYLAVGAALALAGVAAAFVKYRRKDL